MRRAVIDVGSNSVLLLVEERIDGAWKVLDEATRVTSLGEGVKSTGKLGEPGMIRTLGALEELTNRAKALGVDGVSAYATMAVRLASNRDEFLTRSVKQGTPVAMISGEMEADLGFLAVADDPTFARRPTISIVDVGGQSTEIVVARRENDTWSVAFRNSFGLGTLALLDGPLHREVPSSEDVFRACTLIDETLAKTPFEGDAGHAITLGATGTNFASIIQGLRDWEPAKVHGFVLDFGDISREAARLFAMTIEERSQVVGIEPGREKTLPAGALILERALHALRRSNCSVSVRGWRHAALEKGLP